MGKYQFKRFEQVLVRDNDTEKWRCDIFSNYRKDDKYKYGCIGGISVQCIPYNENTAHLVDTCDPYKEPKPKVWRVINSPASFDETYTDDDFKHFIENAVINNKDITSFHVMYIRQ